MEFKPGSIDHRKKVAEKYGFDEQEVIDLRKREFRMLCVGLEIGEKFGARKVIKEMKEISDAKKEEENKNYTSINEGENTDSKEE